MKSKPGIYKALGSEGFELCHPLNKEDFETINVEVNGTPRQSSWKPISVRLIHESEGKALATSDSPWLGYGPLILRASAVEKLGTMFREHGELLPLTCSEAALVIYNPTRVIDALDDAASSVARFSDGRIMMIDRYAFRADVIADIDIFMLPNLRVSPTFLSHRFVDLWGTSGLTGLQFKQVWTPRD